MKKELVILFLLLVCIVSLSGCNSQEKDRPFYLSFGNSIYYQERSEEDKSIITYRYEHLIYSTHPCIARIKTEYYLEGTEIPENILYTKTVSMPGEMKYIQLENSYSTMNPIKKIKYCLEWIKDNGEIKETTSYILPTVEMID
ncbi:MAG: hypothetical protein WC483_04525 [Candidatus Paceibacterota bacterium]|jgi:hypothetical protein